MKPGPMRLLIAEYNSSTGTETVSLGIVPELLHLVDCVVWALPSHRAEFYKKLIPPSDRLIYEDVHCPKTSGLFWKAQIVLRQLDLLVPRTRILPWLSSQLDTAWQRRLIRKYRLTHFFTTWIFNVDFPRLPIPIGAMAMDLNWQHFPENFPELKRPVLDRMFEQWLSRSAVVFPISDFTGEEIKRSFPKSAQNLKVVPHGARAVSAASLPDSPPAETGAEPRKYFYCPASALAHKDHGTAIKAALALYAGGHDFDLVFSGGGTERFHDPARQWNASIASIQSLLTTNAELIAGRIKTLGILDRAKVEELFNGATAVVLPSRFEGFGLPLLEAIERGARAICTDIPPFLEQIRRYDYAEYAHVFPAGDAPQLARLMEEALTTPAPSRPLPKQIVARTQRWTWKDAAAAYVDSLQETNGGHAP